MRRAHRQVESVTVEDAVPDAVLLRRVANARLCGGGAEVSDSGFTVSRQPAPKRTLPADLPAVDIAPERHGSERRSGQEHAARPGKGVVDPLARGGEGLVRHEEGGFGLHAGRADVGALLQVEDVDQVAGSVADLTRAAG